MNKRLVLALISFLFVSTSMAAPVPPATNKDGSVVSGLLTADFNPLDQVIPFPSNLMFEGTTDLTLAVPADNPLTAALSAMDGFSPIEKWTTGFSGFPNSLDPASVVPGQSVRVFQVSVDTVVYVTGIVRELTPGVDFHATMVSDTVLAIIPLKPLQEMTTYMAVLTNDINDTAGNDASADTFYHLGKSTSPWVDEDGNSTYPLIPDDLAPAVEGLRLIVNPQEDAAVSAGIPREDIILSWTVQTQAITPVLKNLRSIARPAPTEFMPTGMTTADTGGFGTADIYMGVITLPYYLGIFPDAANPIAPLTDSWKASPGAYVPPFDSFGLDPTSTHVTYANPFPVKTSDQTVPLLITVPNAQSGQSRPAAGWPVVIFGHGLGQNRTNLLFAADSLAAAGFAVIGMDFALHGLTPEDTAFAPLYSENTPWADVANERTFDVDYIDNVTGAPGPDGRIDASGSHFFNFGNLLVTRDNMRQTETDLSILAVSLPFIDIDGDSLPDLDASTVNYASFSGGSVFGTPFTAIEPIITNSFMSVGMGGVVRGLEASDEYGPIIRAGLAGLGILPGTAEFESFLTIGQTAVDSGDPINWAAEAARLRNVVVHEVIGDGTVPNYVLTAPLSGTEPMIATMGLTSYSSTIENPDGVDAAGRFLPPAAHGSLLDPQYSPAATVEMQKQMASFLLSRGKVVFVEDASTMLPIEVPAAAADSDEEAEQ